MLRVKQFLDQIFAICHFFLGHHSSLEHDLSMNPQQLRRDRLVATIDMMLSNVEDSRGTCGLAHF